MIFFRTLASSALIGIVAAFTSHSLAETIKNTTSTGFSWPVGEVIGRCGKVAWKSTRIQVEFYSRDGQVVPGKSIKIAKPLVMHRLGLRDQIWLGAEIALSPATAVQREKLFLYKPDELKWVWEDIRKTLSSKTMGKTASTALVRLDKDQTYLGVPVKWNTALAVTMEGAFAAGSLGSDQDNEPPAAAAFIDSIITSAENSTSTGNVNNLLDTNLQPITMMMQTESDPHNAGRLFLKNYPLMNSRAGDDAGETAFIAFSRPITEFVNVDAGASDQLRSFPQPLDVVYSLQEYDGSPLIGRDGWAVDKLGDAGTSPLPGCPKD